MSDSSYLYVVGFQLSTGDYIHLHSAWSIPLRGDDEIVVNDGELPVLLDADGENIFAEVPAASEREAREKQWTDDGTDAALLQLMERASAEVDAVFAELEEEQDSETKTEE
jgi:hypothetical protein